MPRLNKLEQEAPTYSQEQEEEYGPFTMIYINRVTYRRLLGDETCGKWYQESSYRTSPTTEFCIQTRVPEGALTDGLFHPDRFEPDLMAEMCKEVQPKKNGGQEEQRKKPRFRAHQTVWVALCGAGVTSYEEHTVLHNRRGEVWLDNGSGNDPTGPFDPETGKYGGSTVFGFSMKLLSKKPDGFDEQFVE